MAHIPTQEVGRMKNKIKFQQRLIDGLITHQDLQQNAFTEIIEHQQAMIIRLQDQQTMQQKTIEMILQKLENSNVEPGFGASGKQNVISDDSRSPTIISKTYKTQDGPSVDNILEWDKPLYAQESEENEYQHSINGHTPNMSPAPTQRNNDSHQRSPKSTHRNSRPGIVVPVTNNNGITLYDSNGTLDVHKKLMSVANHKHGLIPQLDDLYPATNTSTKRSVPQRNPYERMKSPKLIVDLSIDGDNTEGSLKRKRRPFSLIGVTEEDDQDDYELAQAHSTKNQQRDGTVIKKPPQKDTPQKYTPQSHIPQSQPSQAQPSQVQPSQVQPSQAQLPQAQLPQAQLPQAQLPQAQLPQAQSAQAQPSQTLPSQAQPSQALPSQAQPAQAQPSQAQPSQALPSQAQPAQALPSQALPSQAQPSQAQPYTLQYLEAIKALVGTDNLNKGIAMIEKSASTLIGQLATKYSLSFSIPWAKVDQDIRQQGVSLLESEMQKLQIPIKRCYGQWIAKESMQHEWDLFHTDYTRREPIVIDELLQRQTPPQENGLSVKRRVGRPAGSANITNRQKPAENNSSTTVRRRPGRPPGAKNRIQRSKLPKENAASTRKSRPGRPPGAKNRMHQPFTAKRYLDKIMGAKKIDNSSTQADHPKE